MPNPWLHVPLAAYEGHMALDTVYQLQTLSALVKARLTQYNPKTIAIWGLAGGNGLAHIDAQAVERVVGVDINGAYLRAAAARYPALGGKLTIVEADLTKPAALAALPATELVIADLVVEYIGVEAFCARVYEAAPAVVCCVIQQNNEAAFVSASPYEDALAGIGGLHQDIEEAALLTGMKNAGYTLLYREEHKLKNEKAFVRLDFSNHSIRKGDGRV